MNMKRHALASLLLAAALLAGCGQSAPSSSPAAEEENATADFFAMDTYMSVSAFGEGSQEAVTEAEAEVHRLDALLSTGEAASEVGKINADGGGTLSEDGQRLMEASLQLYEETGGCFDISIYPVMKLWGFTDQNYRVPSEEELRGALELVDASAVRFDAASGEVSFEKAGMQIDFGGIAKGYASSRIVEIFQEKGIAHGLVNLGGNVQALGTKPDGSDWRIGIQRPDETGGMLGVVSIHDCAVITSGGYERYFEENGKTYHHIIDPADGFPSENGLVSVSIICADGMRADGLSTSLFVMGREKALDYWKAHSSEFDAVLLEEDGSLWVTAGIADRFTSDLEFTVVKAPD